MTMASSAKLPTLAQLLDCIESPFVTGRRLVPGREIPTMGTQSEVDFVKKVAKLLGIKPLPIVNDFSQQLQLPRAEDSVVCLRTNSSGGVWAATLDGKKVMVKYFNCFQTEDHALRLKEAINEAHRTSVAAGCGIGPQFHGLMVFSKNSALQTKKLLIALVL